MKAYRQVPVAQTCSKAHNDFSKSIDMNVRKYAKLAVKPVMIDNETTTLKAM